MMWIELAIELAGFGALVAGVMPMAGHASQQTAHAAINRRKV